MRRASVRGSLKARAVWLGLFSCVAFAFSGCAPKTPAAIAAAADRAEGVGIYTWLAEHDPSALVVVDLDAQTVRAVAPSARTFATATTADTGCALARRSHALLVIHAEARTPKRDRANDCGFAIYTDPHSLVVAPQ
jgi:hypothetical protein